MNFEDLIKRISPTLKKITYKLNGRFTFFNEEDLYQEALLHLWISFQEGKLEGKNTSYILQGCYFHLKNYLRKVKQSAIFVSIDSLSNEEDRDLEKSICLKDREFCFDHLDINLLLMGIQNNGLTQREKEVLSLGLEGLTLREIGKKLGISHVRVIKIRKKIKEKIQEKLPES